MKLEKTRLVAICLQFTALCIAVADAAEPAIARLDPVRLATPVLDDLSEAFTEPVALEASSAPTLGRRIEAPGPVSVNLAHQRRYAITSFVHRHGLGHRPCAYSRRHHAASAAARADVAASAIYARLLAHTGAWARDARHAEIRRSGVVTPTASRPATGAGMTTTPNPDDVPDIFLSYAHEDRACAQRLATAFAAQGWRVWWDRDISVGAEFDEVLEAKLSAARVIVVLWSEDSVRSSFVKDESARARDQDKLHPVRIDEVELPLGFGQIQTFDLIGCDTHGDEFSSLLVHLAAALKQPAAPVRQAENGWRSYAR